jgi:hypothetical protein
MPETVELMKVLKECYSAKPGKPALVEVPPISYLMVDGVGDPSGGGSSGGGSSDGDASGGDQSGFAEAMAAFYPVAYTLKFGIKKGTLAGTEGLPDFKVMPPEGLWWNVGDILDLDDRSEWNWTALMAVPDFITQGLFGAAREESAAKGKGGPALSRLRLEVYEEGLSAQVMHIGPYAAERPTIEALHAFIAEQGCAPRGKHHEIYFGDPRRTDPAKLKTLLRQPVRRV